MVGAYIFLGVLWALTVWAAWIIGVNKGELDELNRSLRQSYSFLSSAGSIVDRLQEQEEARTVERQRISRMTTKEIAAEQRSIDAKNRRAEGFPGETPGFSRDIAEMRRLLRNNDRL